MPGLYWKHKLIHHPLQPLTVTPAPDRIAATSIATTNLATTETTPGAVRVPGETAARAATHSGAAATTTP